MAAHDPEVGAARVCVALGHHPGIPDHVSPLKRSSLIESSPRSSIK
jgi:hypothetical protein